MSLLTLCLAGLLLCAWKFPEWVKEVGILALALGLLVSGGVHAVKSAAVRPAVTTTTGGSGNVPVSVAEDVTSTTVSIISVVVPIAVLVLIVLFFTWVIWHFYLRTPQD